MANQVKKAASNPMNGVRPCSPNKSSDSSYIKILIALSEKAYTAQYNNADHPEKKINIFGRSSKLAAIKLLG
jgi:hypothetical protein